MTKKMLEELARNEAEVLLRNGWEVSVLRFRSVMRNIPEEQKKEFKKLVEEEYKKL